MRNPNRVPAHAIGREVWDMNFEPSSNVIDVYISAAQKIDRGHDVSLIHTVKAPYRFGVME